MKFIIKLHPEIMIKSKSVRKRFTKLLQDNIRLVFKRNELSVKVSYGWDKLLLKAEPESLNKEDDIVELLQRIPGIDQVLLVQESSFTDLSDISAQIMQVWQYKLADKTFAIRVKRRGSHPFTSMDVAKEVGGEIFMNCKTGGVNLNRPDVFIEFEVDHDKLIQYSRRVKCIGGMPLPSQEDVLSLMSGGFDSGVASYQVIRRGARTHFCFFNLGGNEHEIGVKQVSYYLWKRYSESHRVKFVVVDFAPVVAELLENIENSQMGVVLKRMMMRAASSVADSLGINTLVTGESLGQVSSQTTTNLHIINQVTNKLILRPLICMDKQDIIEISKEIGTEDFAKVMPEYCGVISRKPTARAVLSKIEEEESNFDFEVINKVVTGAKFYDIQKIADDMQHNVATVESVSALPDECVILDIRSVEEFEHSPLSVAGVVMQHLPFFKLANQFADLPQDKRYYLYCDRGVMSQLQALLLHEQGFTTVKVYRPKAP